MRYFIGLAVAMLGLVTGCARNEPAKSGEVVFSGGHDTEEQDKGRPVVLIASALKVKPEVFRDAFRGVTPSKSGPPTDAQARANKKVLMDALGPHGVTGPRLDEVSNYYRYKKGDGELWRHSPAKARAIIKDGKVTGVDILDAGSGYSSPPSAKIAGHENVKLKVSIGFDEEFSKNGRITAITVE